ncbi:Fructose-specific phosphotransferase enzyme IIA component [Desulfonema limicola]|uniref:Fructose-specific phosphotransferase enzyme IIA component n=1 Tax=Desulfonema limicola TaxID=45656 RepID=A0A975BDL0_9BACT|nr:PTS fructose transporter subunit IIA [Desulfonema limicola]QTA83704.1 Fructose-specific phosphotransferase enzyme IIA component [Desulfonema limicola]
MIGIVIVTHGNLGSALLDTAEFITGAPLKSVKTVSVISGEPAEKLRDKVDSAIKCVDQQKGVLIFTDMFGGTSSDMSYSFLETGKTDVISAINLPILLRAVTARQHLDFIELGKCLTNYGKKNISLASEILKGRRRSEKSGCKIICLQSV